MGTSDGHTKAQTAAEYDMKDERRYREDEVKEIFDRATDATKLPVTSGEGLTLKELQRIGQEVGIEPERVAHAATAIDQRDFAPPRRTFLGLPISVGKSVDLPRAPTDREWEMLVSELRTIFHAQGKLEGYGGLRQWTNGNLHACIEPTATGYRLRMGSFKESTVATTILGTTGMGLGLLMAFALAAKGRLADEILFTLFFFLVGGGTVAWGALRLPRWAKEREKQMEYIGLRAQSLISADAGEDQET